MASRGGEGRTQDRSYYCGLRGRSGRLLAGPLAESALKRAFLGWLRGERNHCKMCAIPTAAEEDAKRPHRERETLVGEQTTTINRIKATLARLGIRNFNPKLKKAAERLEHLRTPEGEPIPPNT